MISKLNSVAFWSKIQNLCLKEWDPIGVSEYEGAQDEYDCYVEKICQMLIEDVSREDIYKYLWWVETEHMSLQGNGTKLNTFIDKLLKLKNEENT